MNDIAKGIHSFKQNIISLKEIVHEIVTPIPARPLIVSYGDLEIDQTTNRCWHKGKEYRFRKGSIAYILLNLLVSNMGNSVSHQRITQEIQKVRGIESIITKNIVSSSVRELRRKFGINSRLNPKNDIFLATGDGYSLISN